MRIFVTGGAGYVGCVLVNELLALGHIVTVLDLGVYGKDVLVPHDNLTIIWGDIRDQTLVAKSVPGHEVVIHLACISNDPSFDLNPELGKSVNLDCFPNLVEVARDSNVKKFIYASSSSVYGVKHVPNVDEDMDLEPLTDYSKFKADCERVLWEIAGDSDMCCTVLRPATVCGNSPRLRLDVVVNIFANLAFHKREISVFGGEQLRPNIHILDMVRAYIIVLESEDYLIRNQVFNVGWDNLKVSEIAEIAKKLAPHPVDLAYVETDDIRSYHVSSDKIKHHLGFTPRYTVSDAIEGLYRTFDELGLTDTLDNDKYFNVKRMQKASLE